jgi:hypothetical protein
MKKSLRISRALGCDEDPAYFEEELKKVASAKIREKSPKCHTKQAISS